MSNVTFVFAVDSVAELITNSSSELFVLEGETKNIVEEMIGNVHPNYLDEYRPLVSWDESVSGDDGLASEYVGKCLAPILNPSKGYQSEVFGIPTELIINNHKEYVERCEGSRSYNYFYPYLNRKVMVLLKPHINPNGNIFFLGSSMDNPNCDYMEKLETIGQRYHGG